MKVFNKRNALIGFLTLKLVKRRLRRKGMGKGPKIALFSLLGIASLVGVVAVLMRRRNDEEFGDLREEAESEIVGEYVTASSSPIPAT